ncbi:MAG: translocation/assembly module TamB domain-containing protein [Burkholderiaceae bacterium]|nr:translocation/assembly module TamB domain-containing protein [Burkholderiaceae bacterium]
MAWRKTRWTMTALIALVLALAFGLWVLGQTVALRFAFDQASSATDGKLSALGVRGTLYGGVRIARLRWQDKGLDVDARNLTVRFSVRALLEREIRISRVHVASIDVTLPPPRPGPVTMPETLALPVPVDVASLLVDRLTVHGAGSPPVVVEKIGLSAHYRDGRFRAETLRAAQRELAVRDGYVEMADTQPYALQGEIALGSDALRRALAGHAAAELLQHNEAAVALSARGDLHSLELIAATDLSGASLEATATLRPLTEQPFTAVDLSLSGLDLRRFVAAAPSGELTGTVQLRHEGGWRGKFELVNAGPGALDRDAIPLTAAQGDFAIDDRGFELSALNIKAAGGGTVTGRARIELVGRQGIAGYEIPIGDSHLAVRSLDLQSLVSSLRTTRLDGTVAMVGGAILLDLSQGEVAELGGPLALKARVNFAQREVIIDQAQIVTRDGTVNAAGNIRLDEGPRLAFAGSAENFDPGRWLEQRDLARGRVAETLINGDFRFDVQAGPILDGSAALELRASRWAGEAVAGRIKARVTGSAPAAPAPAALDHGSSALAIARVSEVDVDLTLGGNRVRANGALGQPGDQMSLRVAAPRLKAIDPRASGQLTLEAELQGRLGGPAIKARIEGSKLAWGDQASIGAITARIELPDLAAAASLLDGGSVPGNLTVALRAEKLGGGAAAVDLLTVDASGSIAAHRFVLSATTFGQTLETSGSGSYVLAKSATEPGSWQAKVLEAKISGAVAANLKGPAQLSVGSDGVSAQQWSLTLAGGTAAIATAQYRRGRLQSSGQLADLQVARLLELADSVGRALGRAPAVGRDKNQQQVAKELEGLRLDAKWELAGTGIDDLSGQLNARLHEVALEGVPLLQLGSGSKADLKLSNGRLDGSLELALPSLAFSRRYTGAEWAADGQLRLDGRLGGSIRKPIYSGEIIGDRLQLLQRSMGWRLSNGALRASFDGENLIIRSLRIESGKGSIELRGSAQLLPVGAAPATGTGKPPARVRGRFELLARQLPIPIGPGQRLTLSGDTAIVGDERALMWTGKLAADEGLIELRSAGVPELPDDVFLSDRSGRFEGGPPANGGAVAKESPLRLAADVEIDLGKRLRVRGGGLDARLEGSIRLTGTLPSKPRATGLVRAIDGVFVAYGQKLEVSRGILRFQGELDNPALDIEAVRRFLAVTPGVAVTGTALSPRVKLISTPEVPDAEKLSWLVLGSGLDEAGGGAQTFALRQAASTLLGNDDGTLSGGIGQALGIDVLAVGSVRDTSPTSAIADRGMLGAQTAGTLGSVAQSDVVTIGKRLSSRLYLSYELGLRGVWNLVRIQYDISDRLSLRAQTGTENAVDLLWYYWFD